MTCFVLLIETERAALNAGTGKLIIYYDFFSFSNSIIVGFDRNIYSGNPSLDDLKSYSVKASAEEQG